MPSQLLIFLSLLLLVGTTPKESITEACCIKEVAKCVGANPCKACSTCSSCKFCIAGNTCGACIRKTSKPQEPTTGQCKAITKKGSRCSRAGTDRGYCWQHKN